tara:strand:- start:14512 stop:15501 length:990 start_codon:yes stop_codon:yes gene_type:complete
MSSFQLEIKEIVKLAYRNLGITVNVSSYIDPSAGLKNDLLSIGVDYLNLLVKSWYSEGIFLWMNDILVLGLEDSSIITGIPEGETTGNINFECVQSGYNLPGPPGGLSTNNWRSFWKQGKNNTTVNVYLPNTYYKTIRSLDIPNSASGIIRKQENSKIIPYLLDVNGVKLKDKSKKNDSGLMLEEMGRDEYFKKIDYFSTGKPSHYYIEKFLEGGGSLTSPVQNKLMGRLHLFPYPDKNEYQCECNITTTSSMDINIDGDNRNRLISFPIEWGEALVDCLTVKLAISQGVPMDRVIQLRSIADVSKKKIEYSSMKNEPVRFIPQGYDFD